MENTTEISFLVTHPKPDNKEILPSDGVVRQRLRVMISWQDKPVRVRARLVPRCLWTTASIDVFLADRCVLRTGGQAKLKGSYSASFSDGGSEHKIEVKWGISRNHQFPYQLRIDGVAVDDSRVQVENPHMIFIPACIIVALFFLFFNFVLWPMITQLPNKTTQPPDNSLERNGPVSMRTHGRHNLAVLNGTFDTRNAAAVNIRPAWLNSLSCHESPRLAKLV